MDLAALRTNNSTLCVRKRVVKETKRNETKSGVYVCNYIPVRRNIRQFCVGNIRVVSPIRNLAPIFPVGLKLVMKNEPQLMSTLKFVHCKDLSAFFLVNEYKTKVFKSVMDSLKVDANVSQIYKLFHDTTSLPKTGFLRRMRQSITLIDFYTLMDVLECNVIIYNSKQYVAYTQQTASSDSVVMRIESPYDLTYMGLHYVGNIL